MPVFKSFSASIVVDGKPLDEYNIETSNRDDGVTIVACWIPSEAGKNYQVHWSDTRLKHAIDGQVYVDGHFCGGRVLQRKDKFARKKGLRDSPTSVKLFQFSPLSMTENDEASMIEMPHTIGQIELHIQYWHVSRSGKTKLPSARPLPVQQIFSEKAKKGIDHQTSFSETVYDTRPKHTRIGKPIGECFLQFHFRYRPLGTSTLKIMTIAFVLIVPCPDILRAHGIAPKAANQSSRLGKRPRSPSHVEDVKPQIPDIIEVSDDDNPQREMERLQGRVDELRAKKSSVRDRKKIKHEPDGPHIKMESSSSGPVTIDLT
ncbi:hypothetical protein GYMLUDRAFT_840525 [Collybiopsis luxurians FD-317 M1]|uniref:DUF7918 domain-containing protein n=1 Tax=Collybiopsis luxurians FD-317 M1 TaxID=944289 RepID=A0A0D0BZS3_9AGAR|nr:hypothetical protein GYMLUDRAFT_840525 [Collybiopsis luxurians FD-317 M1]